LEKLVLGVEPGRKCDVDPAVAPSGSTRRS